MSASQHPLRVDEPEILQSHVEDLFEILNPLRDEVVATICAWIEKNKIDPGMGKIITTRAVAGLNESVLSQLARQRLKQCGLDCDSPVGKRFLERFSALVSNEERRQQDWRESNFNVENSGNP